MGFSRIKYGGDGLPYNYSQFLCDEESDLSSLPVNAGGAGSCSFGSKAFVLETQKNYILGNDNTWSEVTASGSGGGSIDSDSIASVDEVLDYLGI